MKPNPRLAHRVVEGRVFVVDSSQSLLHSLSETGSFIWKALCRGAQEDAIAAALAAEYEVTPKQAVADVRAFCARLSEMGLIKSEMQLVKSEEKRIKVNDDG